MVEAALSARGPLIVYVEVVGPHTSALKHLEIVTASGVELVPQLTVRAARCLGQTVKKLEVVYHDLPPQSPVKGLLGLNFLRHVNVHLNFLQNVLRLYA